MSDGGRHKSCCILIQTYELTQQRVKDSADDKTVHVLVPWYRKINSAWNIRQAITRLFASSDIWKSVCCGCYSNKQLEFCRLQNQWSTTGDTWNKKKEKKNRAKRGGAYILGTWQRWTTEHWEINTTIKEFSLNEKEQRTEELSQHWSSDITDTEEKNKVFLWNASACWWCRKIWSVSLTAESKWHHKIRPTVERCEKERTYCI